ncbi:hypothetical protein [Helicobacter sp. 11S02629-2]|uniref:hypothetical protein n=1 Tax=Helicobacter sp. 11S02629-2 TaxID=1476195 RepID=UPI0015DA23A5|nr:hypothetical protein [Helicobacter sp. 11S02629-2]
MLTSILSSISLVLVAGVVVSLVLSVNRQDKKIKSLEAKLKAFSAVIKDRA